MPAIFDAINLTGFVGSYDGSGAKALSRWQIECVSSERLCKCALAMWWW